MEGIQAIHDPDPYPPVLRLDDEDGPFEGGETEEADPEHQDPSGDHEPPEEDDDEDED